MMANSRCLLARRFAALINCNAESKTLLLAGLASVLLKITHACLTCLVAVVLARALGPQQYGIYAYALALITVLAIPAQFGLPDLVVRETAKAYAQMQWGQLRGIWRWANRMVGASSIAIALIAGGAAYTLSDHLGQHVSTFAWSLLLVPLISLSNLRGAALRGLRKFVVGQLPESLLLPGAFVLLVSNANLFLPKHELTATSAMALHALAAAFAFLVGTWLLRQFRPKELKELPPPEYQARLWRVSVIPFALIASIQLINSYTDILVLGLFEPPEKVGIYWAATQASLLVTFGLHALNMTVGPQFARIHAHRDSVELQRTAALTARTSFALALPAALLYWLLGEDILRLVFGANFGAGHLALSILAFGQIVNVAMGPVGYLLNMTGHERETTRGFAAAAVCNITLNFLLIPLLGMAGAAIATTISVVLWNLMLHRAVLERLGIRCSVFSSISEKSGLRQVGK